MGNASIQLFGFGLYLGFLVLGVGLLALGVRGRLVADQPRCARCGQRVGAGEFERSGRCPECGRDVRAEGALRYFRRRVRGRLIVAGIAVGSLSILGPFAASLVSRGPAFNISAPTASLIADLPSSVFADSILIELDRRLSAGELSDAELKSAVEATIAWHEAERREYLRLPSATLLTAADAKGMLSDADMRRLATSVFPPPKLAAPRSVREGTALELHVQGEEMRMGLARQIVVTEVREDDREIPVERPWEMQVRVPLAVGAHALAVGVASKYRFLPSGAAPPGPARLTIDESVPIPILVVPRDAPPLLPTIVDPALRDDVRAALRVRGAAIDHDSFDGSCIVRADLEFGAVEDIGLSFDIFLRVGDREIPFGMVRVIYADGGRATTTSGLAAVRTPCPPADAPFAVVFRPDPIGLEGNPAVTSVWGEEVVVEGFRVARNAPSMAPSAAPASAELKGTPR